MLLHLLRLRLLIGPWLQLQLPLSIIFEFFSLIFLLQEMLVVIFFLILFSAILIYLF